MTLKLYENNSYIKEFTATVLSIEASGENFEVILDQTAFFPEGGGQAADKGEINGIAVLDVQEKGDTVVHTLAQPLEIGKTVNGKIDWPLRFLRMQNHCAEHILSGVIHKMFGYNNVGIRLFSDTVNEFLYFIRNVRYNLNGRA